MKKLAAVFVSLCFLSHSFFLNSAYAQTSEHADSDYSDDDRAAWYRSLQMNVQELLPFLFTTGIAIIQNKMIVHMKPEAVDSIALPMKFLQYGVPTAVALSNAYGKIATLRDTRGHIKDAAHLDSVITKKQDRVVAEYTVSVPLSFMAAYRLANTQDALPRIGYVVLTYLIVGGASSPLEHLKGGIASGIDYVRGVNATALAKK